MFDQSDFSGEAIDHLRELCGASRARTGQHQVRDGMDDEWSVIVGLVEGIVACRRLSDFIKQVLRSEERLLMYSTIQAQVEASSYCNWTAPAELR